MQDINSQQKQIVCFNHRVAALVADTGVAEQVNIWGGGGGEMNMQNTPH